MQYTVIMNGISYDLPPYTLAVSDKVDEINEQNSNPNVKKRANYENMLKFIISSVGTESAEEILGSTTLEDMDLQQIAICYLGICKAYDKPLSEAQRESNREALSSDEMKVVLEVLKNADNVDKIMKHAGKSKGISHR